MTVEQRLGALEQIEAIKALKHRYFRACDAKDPDAFRACFATSGADIDYGPLGGRTDADAIAAVFTRIALRTVDGKPAVLDMHHGLHPDITITGAGCATGRWTLKFRQLNLVDRTAKLLTGEYEDGYGIEGIEGIEGIAGIAGIEDGQWKITRSRFRQLWSITRPLSDDTVVECFG